MDELGRLAALREADRPQAALHERCRESRRFTERRRAQAELRIEQLRVPERDGPLRAGRRVVGDDGRLEPEQSVRELARVCDRRRREHELRLCAVHACHASQPPQHVADVRAEDAAVHVRLVDDDVAEVVEHVSPEVVAREHADVEHVRVREDEVRPLADLPPLLVRCVAVVDRRLHLRDRERCEGARLVLRERLRRIEVDRAALRVGGERIEDRQVERERLAGRGSGRDDHVVAGARRRPGLGLVRVQLVDALPCERGVHGGVELRRQRD